MPPPPFELWPHWAVASTPVEPSREAANTATTGPGHRSRRPICIERVRDRTGATTRHGATPKGAAPCHRVDGGWRGLRSPDCLEQRRRVVHLDAGDLARLARLDDAESGGRRAHGLQ